ncbi:MAG: cell division protein FtsZ [Bacteroidales bacterium]|jgi:cell division protein FtsZ|nr:cell division protein FtsZ [Bacteroidales bacterium]
MITFEPKQRPAYIKVLGVGGGGSNAVNHMFTQGIKGVDFVVCNTDVQALESSPVPVKIEMGNKGGLGAGSKPEVGRTAAEESIEKIKETLTEDTQMLFITAGMGGGTGTGAAPIIAKQARELGILTVGIVTLPFSWEGRRRKQQAEAGIEEIKKYVDTLLVISNDKLREQYGNQTVSEAFAKADNVLTSAAKGIAELITVTGYINIDFQDVKTVIEDSGKAIMGSATAEGEGRALLAIEEAMSSPLLNDNDIKGAQNILLYIMTGSEDLTMDEITEITDYVQQECGSDNEADVIWGNGKDEALGNKIGITIIATGFNSKRPSAIRTTKTVGTIGTNAKEEIPKTAIKEEMPTIEIKKEEEVEEDVIEVPAFESMLHRTRKEENETTSGIHIVNKTGGDNAPQTNDGSGMIRKTVSTDLTPKERETTANNPSDGLFSVTKRSDKMPPGVSHTISSTKTVEERPLTIEEEDQAIKKNMEDRANKLKSLSQVKSPEDVAQMENVPAYVRKKIDLYSPSYSSESVVSRYTLGEDENNNPVIKTDNSFLHDNVD